MEFAIFWPNTPISPCAELCQMVKSRHKSELNSALQYCYRNQFSNQWPLNVSGQIESHKDCRLFYFHKTIIQIYTVKLLKPR